MDLNLKGKLAVVTGSTGGIGKETAKSFLQEGATVIVNGRTEEKVQKVVDELSAFGTVHGIAADLSNLEGSNDFISKVNEIGPVDILVNNLAFFEVKSFEEVTDEEWEDYFQTNIMSAVRL